MQILVNLAILFLKKIINWHVFVTLYMKVRRLCDDETEKYHNSIKLRDELNKFQSQFYISGDTLKLATQTDSRILFNLTH